MGMTLAEGCRHKVATLSLKLALLLGLLLLPSLVGNASVATPRSKADGTRGQIVFLSDRTPGLGSFAVAVMNGEGSAQHLLTHPGPRAIDPVWLPGGKQIAFESVASPGDREVYGGVWSMRTNGSHRKWLLPRVTRLPPDPAWSPDGKRMAFVRGSGLYLARVNGGKARPVFWDTRVLAQPAWSPDGRRLAVADTAGILVLAIGATRARLLFRTHRLAYAYAPSWSANGRRIAFIGTPRKGGAGLYLIDMDGTHQRLLMRGVGYSSFGNGPSWSSDSTRIVIGRVTGLGSASDVAVVDVRTARSRTIYRGGFSPQWSPTGRSIAFTADRPAPTGGIYLVRPNGSHRRLLAPIFGYPNFSPDGTRLATVAGGFRGACPRRQRGRDSLPPAHAPV
jgi:dipeptidyl aminopeptidase/acylaminoacyl peptidase